MSLFGRAAGLDRLEYFSFLDVSFLSFKTETDRSLLLFSLSGFIKEEPETTIYSRLGLRISSLNVTKSAGNWRFGRWSSETILFCKHFKKGCMRDYFPSSIWECLIGLWLCDTSLTYYDGDPNLRKNVFKRAYARAVGLEGNSR